MLLTVYFRNLNRLEESTHSVPSTSALPPMSEDAATTFQQRTKMTLHEKLAFMSIELNI